MKGTVKHLVLGASTGLTVFAAVVPAIHLGAELVSAVGVRLTAWDNPVEIFIFLITAMMVGTFPLGLWIVLTDGRGPDMFNEGHEVAEYLISAIGLYLALLLLVCTGLQAHYAEFRWLLTPVLIFLAAFLLFWRWRKVWGFAAGAGTGSFCDKVLPVHRVS